MENKNYKDTLLMPSTSFEMRANLNQKEPLIQEKWMVNNIYQKVLLNNKYSTPFILHDGPPYANGSIHIGHSLNKIIKDIIVRYKNHRGFYCNFIPGWDTHGLPIENAVAKIDKEYEGSNSSVIEKRKKCREYALNQVENQKQQFKRLGLATDFRNTYLTLNHKFVINELNLFKKMIEDGLIFQAFKPVIWSWSSKCALAEAEVEYSDVSSDSIYVAFKLVDESDTSLIIWTTTPWTIPSNLAIAVNPNIEYAYVKVNNEKYVVAKELINSISSELSWTNYEIVKTVLGKDLEHKKYKHPWIDRVSPIILAEYVSASNGTGLVHNAPGFGQDDYYACKKYGIDVYCPIDDGGKFDKSINDSELEGQFYTKSNEIIINRLENSKSLLKRSSITHSVAHDWRTHKPTMYRATKQWFVNISKVKDQICNSLRNDVSSLNKKTLDRIIEMIENRQEWCISRQRIWGVPIPMIFDENYEPIYDLKLISHIISIIEKNGVDIWFDEDANYFIPDWMDKNKVYYKEKDIIDVWFDSGSSFNVISNEFDLGYPADLYFEGSDQFRGWFNSSAINGVIQKGKVPYKFLLQHGFLLDENGIKMSKSKGNTIDPIKVCETYGADILRLWAASSEYSSDLRFGDNILKQVSENYKKIRNTLFRYSLSNLNDFNYKKHFTRKVRLEDVYILSRLKSNLKEIEKAYDKYNFLDVTKIVLNFTNELSQWYFDIIKDNLYCDEQDNITRRQIQSTLFTILKTLMIVLNPIIPHTCEELYEHFDLPNKKESISLEEWPLLDDVEIMTEKQESIFKDFFSLKDNVYQALEISRQNQVIKKNNEAIVYIKNNIGIHLDQLAKWLNVAKIEIHDSDEILIKNANFKKCLRCWNHYEDKDMADDEICSRCSRVININ